jgi:hypothetical protein
MLDGLSDKFLFFPEYSFIPVCSWCPRRSPAIAELVCLE